VPSTQRAIFERRFVRHLRQLTRIYWISADNKKGAGLLALCVAGELGTVYGNVLLAQTQAKVFDAVQNKQAGAFLEAMQVFLAVALLVVFISTYRIYVRNILQIRWREHLTDYFLGEWIGPHAYWHRELHQAETDNPDQRIAQDVQTYVASALGLSLSLLSAVATLISFAGILWRLSGEWPLRLGTHEIWIPGLMMWVALLYALAATWLTNRVGRSLVSINFDRLRFEADFRYGLAGIWPFGAGRIALPAGAQPLFLAGQPYLPIGTLREAIAYPSPPDAFAGERVRAALQAVDLGPLAERLDESAPWDQHLPLDQQVRLTVARALLHEPDWVVLDDTTAGLDEAMEARVYATLHERLPRSGALSLSTRATILRYHDRQLALAPDGIAPLQARPA
jgi:ABC-type uncharacterized transport system fused permease/ATPase subunit